MCQPLSQTQHEVYIGVFVVVDSGFRHDNELVLCVLIFFSLALVLLQDVRALQQLPAKART